MRKYHTFYALLAFFFWISKVTAAFSVPSFPLHDRVEQSSLVGVVKILGVRRGEPPMLEVELDKVYKGAYTSKEERTRRIYIDLTGTVSRYKLLDPTGSSLAKYEPGSLYFVFLKPAPRGVLNQKRVMTPVNWTFETLLSIKNNLISNIERADQFRSTHDYLSAIERIVEIDALPSREQKITHLNFLKNSTFIGDNAHLSDAVKFWLLDFERQMKREKTFITPPQPQ